MFKRSNLRLIVESLPRRNSARIAHIKSAMLQDFQNFEIQDTDQNRIAYLESVHTFLVHQPQTTKVIRTRWVVIQELNLLRRNIAY